MMTRAAERFCERFALRIPILLAPMAGVCPTSLSIALANAGSMGACGALLLSAEQIKAWAAEFRTGSNGPFQVNLWIPDPPPVRDSAHETDVRRFLEQWGPSVSAEAGDIALQDFAAQCEALLKIRPTAASSIMGLYPPEFVREMKARQIAWFATATTVAEAKQAEAAGADVIVAQGMEAGGHRGAFDADKAERELVGLMALVPAVVDAVRVPVIATGGIADGRGLAAALTLGASAAMIGTGFLRCPEAQLHPGWAKALSETPPERTMLSRAFSGRAGRTIATGYARAAADRTAPNPAPYPVQRGLTTAMREEAQRAGDVQRMQTWAGQAAALARAEPAGELIERIWDEAQALSREAARS
ncbi:MAG: NAD(P)H-dependent flavin oxidoreductase [Chthoniobacterales bacterium]